MIPEGEESSGEGNFDPVVPAQQANLPKVVEGPKRPVRPNIARSKQGAGPAQLIENMFDTLKNSAGNDDKQHLTPAAW
jgi:hypothetical protein